MMLARVKLWAVVIALAAGAAVAVAAAWRLYLIEGERARAAAEAARDFRDTTERIGNADVGHGDGDDDLDWLDRRLRARAGGQR